MTSNGVPPGWELLALTDAGVSVLDCEHKTPPDAGHGHPYVAIPDLVDGKLDLSHVRRITDEHLREWTRRTKPQAGDVIVTRRARVGDSAVVPPGLICAIGQNLVILRSTADRVDQRFLRWAARGPFWSAEVDRLRNVGAVFDSLNVRDIARMRIPVPPRLEQQHIASVLGTLDEKIDSNRRLMELLGALSAQWFGRVDRAASGQISLGEVVHVVDCLHSKKPAQQSTGNLLLQLNNIRADGLLDLGPRFLISKADYANWTRRMELRAGDCVITNVGRVGAVARIPDINAALGRNMTGLRCRSEWSFSAVLIEALLSARSRRAIEVLTDSGTVMSALNVRNIPKLPIPALDRQALEHAESTLAPIWSFRERLIGESRTLCAIREELLPKLISGQIRVADTSDPDEVIGPLVHGAT
jgi:type I restriction enzyme, S subunit